MRRPSQYITQWKADPKRERGCKQCGTPRLRKKALVAMLDLVPRKDLKGLRKAMRLAAAQLAGYCSAKCRNQAEEKA